MLPSSFYRNRFLVKRLELSSIQYLLEEFVRRNPGLVPRSGLAMCNLDYGTEVDY